MVIVTLVAGGVFAIPVVSAITLSFVLLGIVLIALVEERPAS
jgi:hypothetical protein